MLANATPSWPEDGSRDWLIRAAEDADNVMDKLKEGATGSH